MLAGKYRVDAVLGAGGMGIVLVATHVHLRQRVAIKLLHPAAATRRGAVERFLREARVAMSMRGEHVVRIFDVGTLEDGSPFIVMECLEGKDLGAVLDASAPLEPAVAVDYILQASEAIAEAHALGVVHRDLKPANLFLTKRVDGTPCVKVLDFGVSKIAPEMEVALDETASSSRGGDAEGGQPSSEPPMAGRQRITRSSALIGSPRYMAPEQIRSPADVDARADVWALGVILFELLTGVPPFDGVTLEELRLSVTTAPTPRVPNVASALQAAIHRCLAKDPTARFASVHALAEALAPFAPGDGALAAARVGRIGGTLETMSDTPIVRDLVRRPGRPMTRMALAALVVAGALAGVVAWKAIPGSSVPEPHVTSSGAAASAEAPSARLAPPQASSASGGAEVPSSPPAPAAALLPPARVAGIKPSRATGTVAGAVADSGTPAAAPAPAPAADPLHLDAGFLFRERK
jgi:serine/threonine-protein kinase